MIDFKQVLRKNKKLIIIILIPLIACLLPILVKGKEARCGFVLIIVSLYWATECLPIGITSLIPIVLFPLLDIMSSKAVTVLYFQDINFLLFGGLVVSSAIELTGLHERISLRALMLFGSNPKWILLGLMLITAFMSLWITNTATCSMMLPIVILTLVSSIVHQLVLNDDLFRNPNNIKSNKISVIDLTENPSSSSSDTLVESEDIEPKVLQDEEEDYKQVYANSKKARHLATCYLLSCSYSSTMGGLGSLVGTSTNVYFKGYMDDNYPSYQLGFLNFAMYALPVSILLILITWLFLIIRFMPRQYLINFSKKSESQIKQDEKIKKLIRDKYVALGEITFEQVSVGVIFLILVALWLSRDLAGVGGWQDLVNKDYVSDTTPAIIAVLLLFICPKKNIFKGEKYEHLLDWNQLQKAMSWGVLLLIGGGLAIADGFQKSGLSDVIGNILKVAILDSKELTLLIIIFFGAMGTEFTSNVSMASILIPIVDRLSIEANVSPIYFLFPLVLTISLAFMLPVATPTNAIVFSNGHVKMRDMISTGAFINIFGIAIVFLAANTWLGAVFNLSLDFISPTTALNSFLNSTRIG